MEPVRIGVLGAGNFAARRHLPDIESSPHLTLTALCRRDADALLPLAARYRIPAEQNYSSWEEMLEAAPLDAVLIATPNALHYVQAKAALEKGYHVLLEKPMALHSSEAWELVNLAEEKKLILAVALNPPYWAHCHQIRRALQSEKMGKLEALSLFWAGSAEAAFGRAPITQQFPEGVAPPTLFRADPELCGGGYFQDGATHFISELLFTTGLKIKRLTALMDALPGDMRALFTCEFEGGAFASLTALGDTKFSSRRLRHIFASEKGTILVEGFDFDTHIVIPGQETRHFHEADLPLVSGPAANFADAVLGIAPLHAPPEHAARVVEVVEAAYRSAASGEAVTLTLP